MAVSQPKMEISSLFKTRVALASDNKLSRFIRNPFSILRRKFILSLAKATGKTFEVRIRTFWDKKMVVIPPEKLSVELFRYRFYDKKLTSILLKLLKSGSVFIDVGAHIGYFSLLASEIVGPKGLVAAFEPTRSIFSILKKNTKTNENILINNLAVFSNNGEKEFHDYGIEYSMFNSIYTARLEKDAAEKLIYKSYRVKVVSLDSYVSKYSLNPDIIKIDAENAEFDILNGMEMLLSEVRPVIVLEIGDIAKDGIASSDDCICYLEERGYTPFELMDGRVSQHMPRERYGYCNLLFVPEGREMNNKCLL